MKKLILLLFLLPTIAFGQGFSKTFGGNYPDAGYSVQQTTDGGFIITGITGSFGNDYYDVWLIKTDGQGDSLWTKTFGGIYDDFGYSVQQTTDGGYIITGYTESFGNGEHDVWLIKTNSQGDSLWTKTFGGSYWDEGNSVQETTDGGYIITGVTVTNLNGEHDVWLIKTNSQGDSLWTKTFGGINGGVGYSVQQTTDGGFIITGVTVSFGIDVWLIKTDGQGDTLWTKTFGGMYDEWGYSVQQTTDGGYIITGYTESFGNGEYDVWLIKTNSQGDSLWTKTFGGSYPDIGHSVQQTTDGGYIITGYTAANQAGSAGILLIKTDGQGDTLWTKILGESSNNCSFSVQQTADGGYIITGYTDSFGNLEFDVWLIKTDGQGVVSTSSIFPNPSKDRKLEKVIDVLGRTTYPVSNRLLFYIYDDGSVEKKIKLER